MLRKLISAATASLVAPITPIDLNDDGMRFLKSGKIKDGSDKGEANYEVFVNPELVAHVVALKKVRSIIKTQNVRRFS